MKDKKKFGSVVTAIVLAFVVIFLLFGSFYTIGEQEQAVVTTFGVAKAVSEPGLHVKIPMVQHVKKVDTTIKGFAIGYNDANSDHGNYYGPYSTDDSLMITSDFNFVNIDFYVEYRVIDPIKMVYASKDPVAVLKVVAQSCIRNVVGTTDVDSIITTGKGAAQAAIKELIISTLEKDDIGLQLVNITIQDAQPPTEDVLQAFTSVEAAKQGKETAINNANKYNSENLPKAEAEADQIVKSAEAEKTARINEALGQAARFEAIYNEYKNYPLITKKRMYFETMREVLPDLEVIIDSGSGEGDSVKKVMLIEGGAGDEK